MKAKKLTTMIIVGMVLGILAGYMWRSFAHDQTSIKGFVDSMGVLTEIFLRLIKMIIAPLVFATLVSGIAKLGDGKSIGRIGVKTLVWFACASLLSLLLGLVMVHLLQPGVTLTLPLPNADSLTGIEKNAISFKHFLVHAFPSSVFDALARNEILQIVVFSLFFGSALAALGESAKIIVELIDALAVIMLKVTTYVMNTAPIAVFAAISATVAEEGIEILGSYGAFMGKFYLSMGVLWIVLILIGSIFLGRRTLTLIRTMRGPLILAFSTASSEAAYPKTLEQLERFGCPNQVASFVLPMGYSFNLDGSMMYCTFATLFIAQAYGIDLTISQEISMLLILMLTSKGMAGIPRASLVVIAATLGQFNIPEAGLLLLLGVDHFLDMGRAATNVVGNAIATAVITKWEGKLSAPVKGKMSSLLK